MKKFYAIIPKEHTPEKMSVIIVSDTRKKAITNWERWNFNETKFADVKNKWKIIKVEVKEIVKEKMPVGVPALIKPNKVTVVPYGGAYGVKEDNTDRLLFVGTKREATKIKNNYFN